MYYKTVNTIRKLATELYGSEYGWSLLEDYDRKGKPTNWRKVYSLDNGRRWYTCKELCTILENAINT